MFRFRNACALLLLFFIGCEGGGALLTAPTLDAVALREGCVGDQLATLLAAVDELAPYAFVRSRAALERLGLQRAVSVELDRFDGDPFLLRGGSLRVRGVRRVVALELEYLRDRVVTSDLARADSVRAHMVVAGDAGESTLNLDLRSDGLGGIAIEGRVQTVGWGDCVTTAELHNVSMRVIADAPGGLGGARFDRGGVTFEITGRDDRPLARGEAALSGHRALVHLLLGEQSDLAEISLVPGG